MATASETTAKLDPIDSLVGRLSSTYGFWINGIDPELDLSASDSIEQAVARVIERTHPPYREITGLHILESRQVSIRYSGPNQYTAVLVDTNIGRKIVLMQHRSDEWWGRVYDP